MTNIHGLTSKEWQVFSDSITKANDFQLHEMKRLVSKNWERRKEIVMKHLGVNQ